MAGHPVTIWSRPDGIMSMGSTQMSGVRPVPRTLNAPPAPQMTKTGGGSLMTTGSRTCGITSTGDTKTSGTRTCPPMSTARSLSCAMCPRTRWRSIATWMHRWETKRLPAFLQAIGAVAGNLAGVGAGIGARAGAGAVAAEGNSLLNTTVFHPAKIQLEPIQEASKQPSQASSTTEADHPSSEATEPLDPIRPEKTELVQLGASLEAADCHSQAWSSLATEPVPMEDPHFPQGEEIKLVQLDATCQAMENSSQPAFDVLPEPSTPPGTTEDLCPVKPEGMDMCLPLQLEASHLAMDHAIQATSALATEPPALPDTTEDLHLLRMEESEMDQLGTGLEAANYQHQGSVAVFTPPLSTEDRRSAAILARKEEIELSYQQFSLTIAVVATMLLQKEPSMEAAMGSALRANLQQVRGRYLQELENFIDSYDSAATSS
ncbi:uncharacterized protein LOC102388265 isoform X2 [Alligator sinensis]|uniref:Uncharacterized protein LOC102388265 isoform X2 n=1 Tax=Alligator sinensis TaxID=38654 RepID=A0A3Q0GQI2_ALLSI|nr:uncharacterized protein LOC102388265 isoform X2 [Alligator sinensis]